jgi:hypothetical protein
MNKFRDEAIKLHSILECQWFKIHEEQLLLAKSCDECPDRFICFTKNAIKVKVERDYSGTRTYEIYAESMKHAEDIYLLYSDDSNIVESDDTGCNYDNPEFEEVDD